MRPHVVVKTLVVNQAGDVLTVRRSDTAPRRPGQWDFPGGWQDEVEGEYEDVLITAERECKEEAGVAVSGLRIIHEVTDTASSGELCTWVAVRADLVGEPDVALGYEHDAYEWLPPEALLERITYDRQLAMLNYAIEHNLLAI